MNVIREDSAQNRENVLLSLPNVEDDDHEENSKNQESEQKYSERIDERVGALGTLVLTDSHESSAFLH